MGFPKIGHAHPSFFRSADTKARLDVRPWPCAIWGARHISRQFCGTYTGRLAENLVQLGAAELEQAALNAGLVRAGDGALSDVFVDLNNIEARVVAHALQEGGRPPLWLHGAND